MRHDAARDDRADWAARALSARRAAAGRSGRACGARSPPTEIVRGAAGRPRPSRTARSSRGIRRPSSAPPSGRGWSRRRPAAARDAGRRPALAALAPPPPWPWPPPPSVSSRSPGRRRTPRGSRAWPRGSSSSARARPRRRRCSPPGAVGPRERRRAARLPGRGPPLRRDRLGRRARRGHAPPSGLGHPWPAPLKGSGPTALPRRLSPRRRARVRALLPRHRASALRGRSSGRGRVAARRRGVGGPDWPLPCGRTSTSPRSP